MDNDAFNGNLERVIDRYEAFSEISTTDDRSIDFNSEFHQMEKNINYYKTKLQNCRNKYENVEMEICKVRHLQHRALLVFNNTQMEEENLRERLKNINLSYEACVEKSGGYEDLNETIRTKINELTTQRSTLMEELIQLRRNANDNDKKLARVKAMITEQEEKNASLLRELRRKSEHIASIPQNMKYRIDAVLEHLKINENDNATGNTIQ